MRLGKSGMMSNRSVLDSDIEDVIFKRVDASNTEGVSPQIGSKKHFFAGGCAPGPPL